MDQVPYYKADLTKLKTEVLEREIEPGRFDPEQRRWAKRILRERYAAPDRSLQKWVLAFAVGSLVVTLATWALN